MLTKINLSIFKLVLDFFFIVLIMEKHSLSFNGLFIKKGDWNAGKKES